MYSNMRYPKALALLAISILVGCGGSSTEDPNIVYNEDGSVTILTDELTKDIHGYEHSNIPMQITLRDGKIETIIILENNETPGYIDEVEDEIIPSWVGLSLEDALALEVDGITGSTITCDAVISSIRLSLQHAKEAGL